MLIDSIVAAIGGVGLAAVIVVPREGPSVLVRERIMRPSLRWVRTRIRWAVARRGWHRKVPRLDPVLDCVLCAAPWCGLAVGMLAAIATWQWPIAPLAMAAAPGIVWARLGMSADRPCKTCGAKARARAAVTGDVPSARRARDEMLARRAGGCAAHAGG